MENNMGRPVKRTEPYRRTTLDLPDSLVKFLKTKPNRTAWITEAIQEKRERELDQWNKEQGNGKSPQQELHQAKQKLEHLEMRDMY